MKRNAFRLSGALIAAFAVAGCTDDPTESLRQGATQVTTSLSYVEIIIGDSVVVTAQTKDAQGNALALLPDVAAANTAIASTNIDAAISGKPAPLTQFSILANGFGVTTVTATSGALSRDITVQTWPGSIGLSGATDEDMTANGIQVSSGSALTIVPTALSSGGNPFTTGNGGLFYRFTSSDASILAIDSVTGDATTAAPGLGVVSVTSTQLSDSASTGATGTLSIEVVPGPLVGTISSATGVVGSAATITSTAGLFDATTVGTFDLLDPAGYPPAAFANDANNFSFVAPPNLSVGAHSLVISGIGPNELAQEVTYTVVAGPDADLWESDVLGPTSPLLSADGRYFINISAADPDDFFLIDNTAGTADLTVDMMVNWNDGAIDVDVVFWDTAGNFLTCGSTSGCTGAHPEHAVATIPAGEAWVLNINYFSGPAATDVSIDITLN